MKHVVVLNIFSTTFCCDFWKNKTKKDLIRLNLDKLCLSLMYRSILAVISIKSTLIYMVKFVYKIKTILESCSCLVYESQRHTDRPINNNSLQLMCMLYNTVLRYYYTLYRKKGICVWHQSRSRQDSKVHS